MQNTTRRWLLRSAALAAAALPAAGFSRQANAETSPQFEAIYDVIVVGSGVAGTIAAIAAAEKGARVLMLEKLNRLGGTSRFSGLNFACVGSPAQKTKGVKDTPEMLARDMQKVSGGFGSYELALVMAQNTARAEKFMTERGVRWDGRLLKLGGHSAERCLIPEGDGAGLLTALWAHMKTLENVTVITSAKADEVILDDAGRAVGVEVRTNYRFDMADSSEESNKTGRKTRFGAKRGVVFATGGFSRDKAFRSVEVPFLAGVSTTTSEGATAASLKTLVRAGARPVHLMLYRFAYALPTEDMVWGMMIDPATGKRFMSEGSSRNTLAEGSLKLRLANGDRKPFMIYDDKALSKFHNMNRIGRSLNGLNGIDGTMYKFDTLEALCEHYGADAKAVAESLKVYNEGIRSKKDAFDKPLERTGRAVEPLTETGPFYGIVVSPRLNYTPGGIRFDAKARALSMKDGSPIPGLYVCGEAGGGLHGAERMTACSMPACAVFGLIAGEEAAAMNPTNI